MYPMDLDAPGGGDPAPSPTAPPAPPPPSRIRGWVHDHLPTAAALLTVGALLGAVAGVGIGAALVGGSSSTPTPAVAAPAAAPRSFSAIAARVLPSVVSIAVTAQGSQDTGSGVIIRSDGYILTNNHVVVAATGGGTVTVTFNDGSSSAATIVATDPSTDLAVVHVRRTGLPAARLGSSASLRVGDPVLAIGSPLGLSGTVTSGIVSALHRPVDTTAQEQQVDPFTGLPTAPAAQTVIDAIQTDAPINPGNSGGPLVDAAGQVVGIDSAIATLGGSLGGQSGSIGVGFAIPIDQARAIADQLIATGHATHPVLGVGVADVTTSDGATHALVQDVSPGGPAARAGIRAGDIVLSVDGEPVPDANGLIAFVRSHQPGQRVVLAVLRGGHRLRVTVRLADAGRSG